VGRGLFEKVSMYKKVKIEYFAVLREQAKINSEELETRSTDARELLSELTSKYNFTLGESTLKVAINEEYCEFTTKLNEGDRIVFIPPVAGG
jgi:molybdopterin converting factor subunit 1